MICATEEFYYAIYYVCSNCEKGAFFPFLGFGRTAVSFNITLTAAGEHALTTDYLKLRIAVKLDENNKSFDLFNSSNLLQ